MSDAKFFIVDKAVTSLITNKIPQADFKSPYSYFFCSSASEKKLSWGESI